MATFIKLVISNFLPQFGKKRLAFLPPLTLK